MLTPQEFDEKFINASLQLQKLGVPPSIYALFAVYSALGVVTIDLEKAQTVLDMDPHEIISKPDVRAVVGQLQ